MNTFEEIFPEYAELEKKQGITDEEKTACELMRKLHNQFPQYRTPQPIEMLDLIMRKENALAIINGTKKVELRQYSYRYKSRLIDKNAEEVAMKVDKELYDVCSSLRTVYAIHFHNYNKSWSLDVECTWNDTIGLNPDGILWLQEKYDFHDCDNLLTDKDAETRNRYPLMFYFELGKILKRENI